MANRIKILCLAVFAIGLSGCLRQSLNPAGYVQWIEDTKNGLKESKVIGSYTFQLIHQPQDYLAFRQAGLDIGRDSLSQIKKVYGNLQYYLLRVKPENGGELLESEAVDEMQYYSRIAYFSGPMQDDITLIDGNDTLPCVLFHFERNYGLSPFTDFVLGFDDMNGAEEFNDVTLLYSDQVLGTGPVMITISEDNLENIPELILNN